MWLVNDLWDYANTQIKAPINEMDLDLYNLANVKAKLIILDEVKDHLICHLTNKDIAWNMWVAMKVLF